MKTIEPRRISTGDTLFWLKEALDLISRRLHIFAGSIIFFIAAVYVAIRALAPVMSETSAILILSVFLIYCAFALFIVLTDMVVLAFLSDNSKAADIGERLRTVLPEQKTLFRLSFMALLVGASIWVVSLTVNPNKDFFEACDKLVATIILDKDNPLFFIFKLTGAILYFLVLALLGLRTFFSIPLVIFHDLSYAQAQSLSQRAIYINMQPMSMALVTWVILFMLAMSAIHVLALILFPLFAAYIYVAYRHIFLGQRENDPAKAVEARKTVNQAVYTDK